MEVLLHCNTEVWEVMKLNQRSESCWAVCSAASCQIRSSSMVLGRITPMFEFRGKVTLFLFDTPPENRCQRNQVENSYNLEKAKFQFVLIPNWVVEVADSDSIWGGDS